MKLKTAHRRKRMKLFGARFPNSALRRVLLCNRFAVSPNAYEVKVSSHFDFGTGYDHSGQAYHAIINRQPIRYYFKGIFYTIKDRIMDRYGKFKGYALQYWTSAAEDYYGDGEYLKDGCHHYHILERIKLGNRILHRPTGHFSFSNDLTGYDKETVGFDEIKKQCVERLEGKKREQIKSVPSANDARSSLYWLAKRYGRLPVKPKVKPRIAVRETEYFFAPLPVSPKPASLEDAEIPF